MTDSQTPPRKLYEPPPTVDNLHIPADHQYAPLPPAGTPSEVHTERSRNEATPSLTNLDLIDGYIKPLDASPWPADYDEVLAAHATYHNNLASMQLDGTDPVLYPIRSRVRDTVDPVAEAFAEQLAEAEKHAR